MNRTKFTGWAYQVKWAILLSSKVRVWKEDRKESLHHWGGHYPNLCSFQKSCHYLMSCMKCLEDLEIKPNSPSVRSPLLLTFALCHLKLVKGLASHLLHFYTSIWWFGTPTQTIFHSLWLQWAACMESRSQGPSPVSSKREGRRKEGFNFHSSMVRSHFLPSSWQCLCIC